MLKKFLKVIAVFLIVSAILICFSLSDYNPIFKNEEYVGLTDKLKKAQKENLKSFTEIYQKLNTKIKEEGCTCERATNYIGPYRHGYSLTKLLYEVKIQRKFAQTTCFKFLLLNTDFKHIYSDSTHKTFGVKEASKFYFNKNTNELSEKEILTVIAMLQNPSLYDPIRNKEGVQNRVRLFERILHNQK